MNSNNSILKYRKVIIFTGLLIMQCFFAFPQDGRIVLGMNDGWEFTKDNYKPGSSENSNINWENVTIPHSWNTEDVNDDIPDYYRGIGWYRKNISISSDFKAKKLFLYFEGANQVTAVYINGKKAGSHIGGYTAFCVPIDEFIDFNKGAQNVIAVKVDNSFNENIPPLTADFTFFGGIYRDVYLVATNPVHFTFQDGAASVFITTPEVSAKEASVNVKNLLTNASKKSRRITISTTIKSAEGKIIAERKKLLTIKGEGQAEYIQEVKQIADPHLWTPEDPYLYTVLSRISDSKTNEVLDIVENHLGFRWFRFDADSGFYLNDKHYKLIGASRHQDFKGLGNALPDSYHRNDIKLLKDLGANFLRVAHYPQDPTVLEMCDKLGILASVEIPIVNAITETEEFYQNSKKMQVEMIRQNFNHPSVILWAYMNEVVLRPKFGNDPKRQEQYFNNITKLAEELEALTRKEDPSRYTMISNHGDFNRYKKLHLAEIPMVVGWNLYQGWYSGNVNGFADFLDRHHKELPNKPLFVTEFGADADPRIHSLEPERFDKSVEYSLNFHNTYLNAINERPFVAAAMIWNLADFNSETREETMPHINNKGLLTQDRKPKDLYYFYQSHLLKNPFVKISNWTNRSGMANSKDGLSCVQPVEIFTNASSVRLVLNGKSLGDIKAVKDRFIQQVPFIDGINTIEALITEGGKEYRDLVKVDFKLLPHTFHQDQPVEPLNILLGSKRFFIEEGSKQVWIPDQAYKQGSWGYVGGKAFKIKGNNRQNYGTDRNINGTDQDPIYQTQQVGIQHYKLDVPDGQYELTLHFSELISSEAKEALAYNLDNSVHSEKEEERVFDVLINGVRVLENFNIRKKYGALTAASEKVKVLAENGKGIEISFKAISGEPVLNALQLIEK